MRLIKLTLFMPILVIVLFASLQFYAIGTVKAACDVGGGALSIPTWYQYLPGEIDPSTGRCQIANPDPANEGSSVILILLAVFDILLFLAGVIAFVMIIWGGFKFISSTGEPQKIAGARTTIVNALIGLAIAIVASQLVNFIAKTLI